MLCAKFDKILLSTFYVTEKELFGLLFRGNIECSLY